MSEREAEIIVETYFGGFFFVKRIPTPSFTSREFLPEYFFSLSDCFCETLPNTWAIKWTSDKPEEKRKIGTEFGLSEQEQQELTEFCTALFDGKKIGWPNVIQDESTAQSLKRWVKGFPEETKLLMIGIGQSDLDAFFEDEKRFNQESGIASCLKLKREISGVGKFLGYEILGFEYGSFHSWFCNGIDGDAFSKFGIKPNRNGFLDNHSDARKICEMANQEEYGSEPVLWIPWKIFEIE